MAGLRKKKYYDNVSLKREQRVETRTNCQAKLCLYFDKSATIWRKFIYTKWDVDEFEEEWSKLVEEFGGSDTSWIDKQYENKESWARAFLRDKFYVGFRTTLRCEGINNFIKRFVHSRHSILELVENLERALRDYHNNEMVAQFKTINSDHVLTTGLQSLELCVANIYTREIFKLSTPFHKYGIQDLCFSKEGQNIYSCDHNEKKLECECCHWDHEGYPCSHMLCVLRRKDVDEFPESLILKRLTRDAKKYIDNQTVESTVNDAEKGLLMRYGAMSVATMWMSFLAAQKVPLFGDTMNEVTRWTKDLEKRCSIKMQNGVTDVLHPVAKFVGDPCVAKTKGAPKLKKNETRKRSCSNCLLVDEGDRSHDHLPSRCTDTDEYVNHIYSHSMVKCFGCVIPSMYRYKKYENAAKEPLGATRSENNGRNCTAESSTKLMGS
ncbi:hypothetical protein Ahy_B10g102067 [Arachis hypogaea]|uniref:Protein FAR1-RELATED SEQUENCE n=1 Tax=Arachis hypogaea TaxID=3818 RepID=A0A444X159_ARAHY|nr:hypothetical protein Ahy_B10g102067 [Arachis hypogaea]